MLDPAGYGAVTIAKAISIVNDGVGTAGIKVSSGNAITIATSGPGDSVYLRGLTIEGILPGASNGILFTSGFNFEIENCVIQGFGFAAINIAPTNPAFVTGVLSNVIINDNHA